MVSFFPFLLEDCVIECYIVYKKWYLFISRRQEGILRPQGAFNQLVILAIHLL